MSKKAKNEQKRKIKNRKMRNWINFAMQIPSQSVRFSHIFLKTEVVYDHHIRKSQNYFRQNDPVYQISAFYKFTKNMKVFHNQTAAVITCEYDLTKKGWACM